jgi:hypothetical protein
MAHNRILKTKYSHKKDPYPLPFTYEILNIVARYETLFLKWIFMISSNFYSSIKHIQDYICYRLGAFIWKVMLFGV